LNTPDLPTDASSTEYRQIERELDFLKSALDEHAIVSITDIRGNIIHANDKFCAISGYSREELIGQNHRILGSSEHSQEFYRDLWKTIASGHSWHGEIKNLKKGGGSYWVKASIIPFLDETGKPFQYVAIRTDITAMKESNKEIRTVLIEAVENIPAAFVVYDENDRLIVCNEKFREFYGYSQADSAPGVTHQELGLIDEQRGVKVVGEEVNSYVDTRLEYRTGFGEEQLLQLADGRQISTKDRPLASGGFVSIQSDVTEIKETQAILEHHATTDHLTGLMNRRTGLLVLRNLMTQHKRSGGDLCICFVDIDGLKTVNDEFGHESGDWLIRTIGNAVKEAVRDSDLVVRLGGDEFLVIFPQCAVELANAKLEAIKAHLLEIGLNENKPFTICFSYGSAAYQPALFDTEDEYIAHCDELMYQNKLERKAARSASQEAN